MRLTEQREKYLKAKVAMALYGEHRKVPEENAIERAYHVTRVLYEAELGTLYLHKQRKSGQLVLF